MPQPILAILLICDVHFAPLLIAFACCCTQLRCWSIMMPRYFVLCSGLTAACGSFSSGRCVWQFWCAKSISASLEYSRGELWSLDHLIILFSFIIILFSILCISSKVLAAV